jgi:hypothetical protein
MKRTISFLVLEVHIDDLSTCFCVEFDTIHNGLVLPLSDGDMERRRLQTINMVEVNSQLVALEKYLSCEHGVTLVLHKQEVTSIGSDSRFDIRVDLLKIEHPERDIKLLAQDGDVQRVAMFGVANIQIRRSLFPPLVDADKCRGEVGSDLAKSSQDGRLLMRVHDVEANDV